MDMKNRPKLAKKDLINFHCVNLQNPLYFLLLKVNNISMETINGSKENQGEMSEAQKAAFELGEGLGASLGTDMERAWQSGNSLREGTPAMEEHKNRKNEAIKNMGDMEKVAFVNGYRKGMNDGKERERVWQSKQQDKQH